MIALDVIVIVVVVVVVIVVVDPHHSEMTMIMQSPRDSIAEYFRATRRSGAAFEDDDGKHPGLLHDDETRL